MSTVFNKVLYAIDTGLDPRTFERLCVDLLCRDGYRDIIPGGGIRDHGRDAEVRVWTGCYEVSIPLVFQFSKEVDWENKLRGDAKTIFAHCPSAKGVVFVTSRAASGEKQDKLRKEFKDNYGWSLFIYDREWLRHQLEELHQDISKKYLDLDLPDTVCHAETLIDLHGLEDDSADIIFRGTTPDKVRAVILARTEKQPADAKAWKRLALVEFYRHDYDAALRAVLSALRINPRDVNLELLRASILAEHGIRTHSRILLVQAKKIFEWATEKLDRPVDHYNLANVLGPLDEKDAAESHYRRCIELKPDYAQAWKNYGSLLFKKGKHEEEMECYAKALELSPSLIEAHLCRGTTYLIALHKPEAAVNCFETAYRLDPELDWKWPHVRYWYGAALFSLKRIKEALVQVNIGLSLAPDNSYLLDQKAALLTKLWHSDSVYENEALEYFKFRVSVKQGDFASLNELIQLFARRSAPDAVWPMIEDNLKCKFAIKDYAEKAGITLSQLGIGFAAASAYWEYREDNPLSYYLNILRDNGVLSNPAIEKTLWVLLMAPFGQLRQKVTSAARAVQANELNEIFKHALADIERIFPVFSCQWLATERPSTQKEQIDLLAIGMTCLPNIVAVEVGRQFGYCTGRCSNSTEINTVYDDIKVGEIYSNVGIALLDGVAKDWHLFDADGNSKSTDK